MKENVKQKCKEGHNWSKEILVDLVTNEKVIQSAMTSMALSLVTLTNENIAIAVVGAMHLLIDTGLPVKTVQLMLITGTFLLFFWADRHPERFRSMVDNVTEEDIE